MAWYSTCSAPLLNADGSSAASAYRSASSTPSVSSYTCTVPRPALFPACTAVSARRSRSIDDTVAPAGATATPMDAVTSRGEPSIR